MAHTDPGNIEREWPTAQQVVRRLTNMLATNRPAEKTFDLIAQEAAETVACEHLFISRYDEIGKEFVAVAWRSSINPGNVSLEQKFMGTSYLGNQPVILNDLSNFNYRLRPAVARLGLSSMAGIPFSTSTGKIGVIEAFAETPDHFSDLDIEYLALIAKQTALVMEKADLERECALRSAETELLIEALKLEQTSIGSLLYKIGETFTTLFEIDGIAVFGIDSQVEGNPLQEVMAKGFAMSDVTRLKSLFNRKYLEQLASMSDNQENKIIKHSLRQSSQNTTKLLYTVPITHKRNIYGIMVFYWERPAKESITANLEPFTRRIISDITLILSRKHLYNNIQKISFSDILTGLANRRLFDYVLDREMKKAARSARPLSLLMLDIDYFKNINDTFGHQVGDAIIEQVGALLKENCRNIDLAARYGGEEFAIILPETERDDALALAERMREKIASNHFQIAQHLINITVSIGVTTLSSPVSNPEALILAADRALYQAKQAGRNVVLFTGTEPKPQ